MIRAKRITRSKGSKYKNKKVKHDGYEFDSKKERDRYVVLKDAESKGIINNLDMQVKFELIPPITQEYVKQLKTKSKKAVRTLQLPITYKCDFQYEKDGVIITEDVKPSPKIIPTEFKLKAKLFFWKFGRKIKLVFNENEEI